MSCNINPGSCSLCPYCGEKQCPHFNEDDDNDKRYWVYATDRYGSYHCEQGAFKTKKESITFIKKLANKKWAKKYRWSYNKKENTQKYESEYLPWIELTITDGACSWYTSVNLLINMEDKTIWYYDKWKTEFDQEHDKPRNIELIKKWDEKLKFTSM